MVLSAPQRGVISKDPEIVTREEVTYSSAGWIQKRDAGSNTRPLLSSVCPFVLLTGVLGRNPPAYVSYIAIPLGNRVRIPKISQSFSLHAARHLSVWRYDVSISPAAWRIGWCESSFS